MPGVQTEESEGCVMSKQETAYRLTGSLVGFLLLIWGMKLGSPFITVFIFLAALFVFVFHPHIVSIDYRLREISKILWDIAEDEE